MRLLDRAAVPWSLGLMVTSGSRSGMMPAVSDIQSSIWGCKSEGNGPSNRVGIDDIGGNAGKTTHPPSKTAENLTKVGD